MVGNWVVIAIAFYIPVKFSNIAVTTFSVHATQMSTVQRETTTSKMTCLI